LDLPEVSLIAILDADKEGFLRSKISLIQTMGRASRHVDGRVIMYANRSTDSMMAAIKETTERRKLQEGFNLKHNITPKTIEKSVAPEIIEEDKKISKIDEAYGRLPKAEKKRVITEMKILMQKAADNLEFERAAELRDQIVIMESQLQ